MRAVRTNSPWGVPDFRALVTATTFSQLALNGGHIAVPLIAVEALDASPVEVGALAALTTGAFLLIGLPAGAWVDRMRQRRVLIIADLARALLFLSIPLAWWLDGLTLTQLYAVVLLNGCATVFFEVTTQSVLPQLVRHEALIQANAVVTSITAAGNVVGRGVGGGLVQLLTAPVAVVSTSVGHLLSALRLAAIRGEAAKPSAHERTSGLRRQIAEGVRHVLQSRELRALAVTGALTNLGIQVINTVLPILFVRELGLSAGALGLFWAVGGIGLFLGARYARPIGGRVGYGRALGLVGLCLAPAGLLVPLLDSGPWLWVAGAGWVLVMFKTGMDNVLGVSLRQRLTPHSILGRMNATFRFLLTGAFAVGAVLAGLLGQLTTVYTALWTGGAILALAFLPVFLSPVRTRRELPAQPGEVLGGSAVERL